MVGGVELFFRHLFNQNANCWPMSDERVVVGICVMSSIDIDMGDPLFLENACWIW